MSSWGPAVRGELLQVRSVPGLHRVALRASLSMLVALAALHAAGHLEWGAYASFGVFASVYANTAPPEVRWRRQAAVGLVLTAAVTSGALVGLADERRWLSIPVAAAWAAVAAGLSDRYGWRPPGPMFPVFAFTTSAAVPATVSDVGAAAGLCAAAATVGVLAGVLEHRLLHPFEAPAPPDPPVPDPRRRRIQRTRCAAAVLVSGTIATASGIGHPYWAMVAAVVPLAALTFEAQLARGISRALGTVVGLGLAAVLLSLQPAAVAIILLVALLQGLTELVVARHYATALVFITPLALLLVEAAVPERTGPLLLDRLVETLVGVGVGLLTVILTRPREPIAPSR